MERRLDPAQSAHLKAGLGYRAQHLYCGFEAVVVEVGNAARTLAEALPQEWLARRETHPPAFFLGLGTDADGDATWKIVWVTKELGDLAEIVKVHSK